MSIGGTCQDDSQMPCGAKLLEFGDILRVSGKRVDNNNLSWFLGAEGYASMPECCLLRALWNSR